MTFLEHYAFDVLNVLFKAKDIDIPIHPSLHTRAHGNFVMLADNISRALVRSDRIERGNLGLTYKAESGALILHIRNTQSYNAPSDEEDDPDQLFTGTAVKVKPWKTMEECIDRPTYLLLLAFFRGLCLNRLDERPSDRVFYFPRAHAYYGHPSMTDFLSDMGGLMDCEEYSIVATVRDDDPDWFVLTFHMK